MRPGRIDRVLYVSPPDEHSAKEIYDIELRRIAHAPGDVRIVLCLFKVEPKCAVLICT